MNSDPRSMARAATLLTLGWAIAACEPPAPPAAAAGGEVAATPPAAGSRALTGAPDGALAEVVTVYRSPTCGCCASWADHLRENGFEVEVVETSDMAEVKQRLGVPRALTSCHTAVVGGRVVEGHVPADALRRFLEDESWSGMAGLAVPGMPVGSPGMEVAGGTADPYDIVAWDSTGATVAFERRAP